MNPFSKKKVRYLGIGGMIFKYHDKEFFIDSEMSFASDCDIVVFRDSVCLAGNSQPLQESYKREVLDQLLTYLEKTERLRVVVHPEL